MSEHEEARLTHLDDQGAAWMVDVDAKAETQREAVARGLVVMQPETLRLVLDDRIAKGSVLAVARVAGVMAAKRTPDLIPLCHPLLLTHVAVTLTPDEHYGEERQDGQESQEGQDGRSALVIEARVRTRGQTGVEMEALTAVSVAALTVYDMCKAVDSHMRLTDIHLVEKRGGRGTGGGTI